MAARRNPLPPRTYASIAAAGIAVVLAALLLVAYVPPPESQAGQLTLDYALLVLLGLAAAVACFGVLGASYARITGKRMGVTAELGGPVSVAALVVAGGVWQREEPPVTPATATVVVSVKDPHGNYLEAGGLTLRFPSGLSVHDGLTGKGLLTFTQVPATHLEKPVDLTYSLPSGFTFNGTDNLREEMAFVVELPPPPPPPAPPCLVHVAEQWRSALAPALPSSITLSSSPVEAKVRLSIETGELRAASGQARARRQATLEPGPGGPLHLSPFSGAYQPADMPGTDAAYQAWRASLTESDLAALAAALAEACS